MAGGALKYRHLNRTSSHRQALLRNLVTSLFTHESIQTTWPKAKEAQRLAEKLITLGKKNTNASRAKAEAIFYDPIKHLPTLFTTLRQRYLHRPGGYTRVLRIEPLNRNNDQAPSAILELVDGPRDMRFAMTAKTLVRERASEGGNIREITARNVSKVTRFRENGEEELERVVRRLESMGGVGGGEEEGKEGEEGEEGEEEKKVEEEGKEKKKKAKQEREPWEPFARMRKRARDKAEEERPLTEREKWDLRRPRRDPSSGRRMQATLI